MGGHFAAVVVQDDVRTLARPFDAVGIAYSCHLLRPFGFLGCARWT